MNGCYITSCPTHLQCPFHAPSQLPAVLDKVGRIQTGASSSPRAKSLRIVFKEQETLPLNILYWQLRFYFNFLNNNIDNLHIDLHFSWIHIIKLHFPRQSNWAQGTREMNTMTSVTARKTAHRLSVLPLRDGLLLNALFQQTAYRNFLCV